MHFTARTLKVTAIGALAALLLALAPGCATAPRPQAIHAHGAHDGLACTPLALTLLADSGRVSGSGVLVHPRVLLTANHVLCVEPHTWMVHHGHRYERTRVQRVVSGGGSGRSGDWALLVLDTPLETLGATCATLPEAPPDLRPGDAVVIAGYPGGDMWDRRPLLIASVCITRPLEAPAEPGVLFVRGGRGGQETSGVSGGPVLAPDGAGHSLVGVYTAMATRRFLGLPLAQEMVIHTLPLDEIRRVIAEVEADDAGAPPPAGKSSTGSQPASEKLTGSTDAARASAR